MILPLLILFSRYGLQLGNKVRYRHASSGQDLTQSSMELCPTFTRNTNRMFQPFYYCVNFYFLLSQETKISNLWVCRQNYNIKHINFVIFDFRRLPFEDRVDQVLAWLDMAPSSRPDFMTLYVNQPDNAAHWSGVRSKQVSALIV